MPESVCNRFVVEYISPDGYDRIKHLNFIECGFLKSVPGIIKEIVGEDCYCYTTNKTYLLPLLQSPKDPTYPCSPKMLEYYKIE